MNRVLPDSYRMQMINNLRRFVPELAASTSGVNDRVRNHSNVSLLGEKM